MLIIALDWYYLDCPVTALLSEGSFVVVVIATLLSALVTNAIGFKYMIGPRMLGLALCYIIQARSRSC